MKLIRRLFVILCLVVLVAGIWGAVYARKVGFSNSWRQKIEEEVGKRGYFIDIGKLTLGPLRGLVAEDIRFYQTEKRQQEIAFVDDVFLDLDLSKVFDGDKQLSINTLDIQDAKLSLPLDPGNPESRAKLRVENLSGRLVVTENQIEVVRAQAEIEGIEISVKGSMFRPENAAELFSKKDQTPEERRDELAEIAKQRSQARQLLREIQKLEYLEGDNPKLEIEFRSDLEDLTALQATGRFTASKFRRGSYTVESLSVVAEYEGDRDRAFLKELHLRDDQGDLRMDASWQEDSNEVEFSLSSTVNLPQLVTSILNDPSVLGDVVFFSPPKLELEGTINLDDLAAKAQPELGPFRLPAEVIGTFHCDRFVSKGGEVFDGLEFDFAVEGEQFYARNIRLDHKTGMMLANVIYEPDQGERAFRYQAELKMDPRTFIPFVRLEETREFLNAWDFDPEKSNIYVASVGEGADFNAQEWRSKGVIDLRNFKLNGVAFTELETEYETDGMQQVFRNVRLARPEGEITADEARHDAKIKRWTLPEVISTVDLIEGATAFCPKEAERVLLPYQFGAPPRVILSGVIDGRKIEDIPGGVPDSVFSIQFSSEVPGKYEFLGQTLDLANPQGVVLIDRDVVHLKHFNAKIFGGHVGVDFKTIGASQPQPDFEAHVELKDIPFHELSGLYSDYQSTEGSLEGQMYLKGKIDDVSSIDGSGAAKIVNGDVFAIPMMGPLSKFIGEVIPNRNAGYSVA
ncbi:MAG: hypothetical protein HKN23_21075, partial [Verrucomicrobiales bacterium]|nr:hypothetical protein [Verrucomicrobiales bacterium]